MVDITDDAGVFDTPQPPRPKLVRDDRRSISLGFIWRFLRGYWMSPARWPGIGLVIVLMAINLVLPRLQVLQSGLMKQTTDAMVALNAGEMLRVTWLMAGLFVVIIFLQTLQSSLGGIVPLAIKMVWRVWSTDHMIRRWFAGHAFQRIEREASVENADQRIAEDVKLGIDNTVQLTQGFVFSVIGLATYVPVLWYQSGTRTFSVLGSSVAIPGYLVWFAVLSTVVGYVLTGLVGRGLARVNVLQQRYEADLRYNLVRARENAEQIAFYRGEAVETARLANVMVLIQRNFWRLTALNNAVSFNGGIFGTVVQSMVPAILFIPKIADGSATPGDLTQVSMLYLQTVIPMMWFMNAYPDIAKLISVFRRLETLDEEIGKTIPTGLSIGTGAGLGISQVHLDRPDGTAMTTIEPFTLASGDRLLVRGPSGVGKSTLLRALAGLWPHGRGRIEYPEGDDPDANPAKGAMFLPQRSYLPTGTLRGVLSYPSPVENWSDADYAEALRIFGLERQIDQLDDEAPWHQRLSPGEQQRIAAARVLLHKPDVLILDEATSALDPANERKLYETIIDRLPHVTMISVAHSPSVEQFHNQTVTLRPATNTEDRTS